MATKKTSKKNQKKKQQRKELIVIAVLVIVVLIALFVLIRFGYIDLSSLLGEEEKTTDKPVGPTPTAAQLADIDLNNCIKVHFIDVGQGDAILVELGKETTLLIDAGHTGYNAETNKDKPYGSGNVPKAVTEPYFAYIDAVIQGCGGDIDYLIATHPDSDHINMIPKVFEKYQVNEAFLNDYYNDDNPKASNTALATETAAENEPDCTLHEFTTADDTVLSFEGADLSYKFTVYSAGNDGFKGARTKANSMSIYCLLEYAGRKVLFTGDGEVETEKWFMEKTGNDKNFDIDVLKVPHHGSTSSSCAEFIDYVHAEYAVVCCGPNGYGLPNENVMKRYTDRNVQIYSTNDNGTVVLYIDGDGDYCFVPEKEGD